MGQIQDPSCAICGTAAENSRCGRCGSPVEIHGYRVASLLADDFHARTYLATSPDGRTVALKEVAFARVPDRKALDDFERESSLLTQFSHPRIPRLLETFSNGEGTRFFLYSVQEQVEGTPLSERLESHRFNEDEVRDIARQVLETLVYLHSLSPAVVHRDIKPAHLLLRPDGSLSLVGFGAAREVSHAKLGEATVVGTFGYMPPEQLLGVADPLSDLYALGATLVHLLAHRPPWELAAGGSRLNFRPHVDASPALCRFLERLVAPNPKQRFASAAVALAMLSAGRDSRSTVSQKLALAVAALAPAALAFFAATWLLGGGRGTAHPPTSPPQPDDVATSQTLFAAAPDGPTALKAFVCPKGTTPQSAATRADKKALCVRPDGTFHGPQVIWFRDDHGSGILESSEFADGKATGRRVVFFGDGFMKEETHWLDGQMHGRSCTWGLLQTKESEGEYLAGKKHGEWTTWNSGGYSRGRYANGTKVGDWIEVDREGRVSRFGFDSEGRKHGSHLQRRNGLPVEKGRYEHGQRSGRWTFYDEPYVGRSEGDFVADLREGEWTSVLDGVVSKGKYRAGQQEGLWTSWYPDGQKRSEAEYSAGKLVAYSSWHDNGNLEHVAEFREGSPGKPAMETDWYRDGTKKKQVETGKERVRETHWHPNGQISFVKEERILDDSPSTWRPPVGTWISWHRNGKKKQETPYNEEGRKNGLERSWFEDGRLKSLTSWDNGTQLEVKEWSEAGAVTRKESRRPQ